MKGRSGGNAIYDMRSCCLLVFTCCKNSCHARFYHPLDDWRRAGHASYLPGREIHLKLQQRELRRRFGLEGLVDTGPRPHALRLCLGPASDGLQEVLLH